ncbi:MAG: site-specific DNA-methyltransferase, partial [Chloroflexi bacterium]|nr:site-specific DNA-methyltransferase [Chloroflexota bacterium]
PQRAFPRMAKDSIFMALVAELLTEIQTKQTLYRGDSTDPEWAERLGEVHLVVTSPPYFNLKTYPNRDGQLGQVSEFDEFLQKLVSVWRSCFDALVPGGRMAVVVGDVCLSRRRHGRHLVLPLHAAIQEQCRRIGFENLSPIFWHKISNQQTESQRRGSYLGKPYEPNGIIKNDVEYILLQRKPGGYRQPALEERVLSLIAKDRHDDWFRQIWVNLNGASTVDHPAPYPVALAERLIKMFSFVGDTVLDPFLGSGSTLVAATSSGRNGIGIEVEPHYIQMSCSRLAAVDAEVEVHL